MLFGLTALPLSLRRMGKQCLPHIRDLFWLGHVAKHCLTLIFACNTQKCCWAFQSVAKELLLYMQCLCSGDKSGIFTSLYCLRSRKYRGKARLQQCTYSCMWTQSLYVPQREWFAWSHYLQLDIWCLLALFPISLSAQYFDTVIQLLINLFY